MSIVGVATSDPAARIAGYNGTNIICTKFEKACLAKESLLPKDAMDEDRRGADVLVHAPTEDISTMTEVTKVLGKLGKEVVLSVNDTELDTYRKSVGRIAALLHFSKIWAEEEGVELTFRDMARMVMEGIRERKQGSSMMS